jgi:hypothetical protein
MQMPNGDEQDKAAWTLHWVVQFPQELALVKQAAAPMVVVLLLLLALYMRMTGRL